MKYTSLIAGLMTFTGLVSAHAQNLIQDPTFSHPPYASTNNFSTYTVGGWTFERFNGGNGTASIEDNTDGSSGAVTLSLSGNTTSNVVVAIPTLTTSLVAGKMYELTFDEDSHSSDHGGINVFVGNTLIGSTPANVSGFAPETFIFTVTAAEITAGGKISLTNEYIGGGNSSTNASIGNFKLIVVPEPNSIFAMAAFCVGIACTVERRRIKDAFQRWNSH